MFLLQPKKYDRVHVDQKTREIMLATMAFFENKGLKKIKEEDRAMAWVDDFVKFNKEKRIFAQFLTPTGYGAPDCRWDMWRIEELCEIAAFYGFSYWYTLQVSVLGLGPIWMGTNEAAKHKTARLLEEGGVFAFGLSERQHGADLYSSEMVLSPRGDGAYVANGSKYYIGNGKSAALVATFGKMSDTGEYVFFVVSPKHAKYEHAKDIRTSGGRQSNVSEYVLHDYPISEADIISRGQLAWDSALSTVNIAKFGVGWASIGICTHALYEAINHASNRKLYGKYVTDFPHVKRMFTEAFLRLTAMKLFSLRAADYMKSASNKDRRYLLYDPIVKMRVTSQGEKVVMILHDIIAAKGFEQDTYFEMAIRDIGMLPRLEGTTHVNMALVIKFMDNYFSNSQDYPEIPRRNDPSNDDYLFHQFTGALGKVPFPDYRKPYSLLNQLNLPNSVLFREQVELFRELLLQAPLTKEQSGNVDHMMAVGELFTLIAYAQLIIENAKIYGIDEEVLNGIFGVLVKDYSQNALVVFSDYENTPAQEKILTRMIKKPALSQERADKLWQNHVYALKDTYTMANDPQAAKVTSGQPQLEQFEGV